jgi:hypothetical protein
MGLVRVRDWFEWELKDRRVSHNAAVRHAVVGHAVVGMTRHAIVGMVRYVLLAYTIAHALIRFPSRPELSRV